MRGRVSPFAAAHAERWVCVQGVPGDTGTLSNPGPSSGLFTSDADVTEIDR